MDYKFSLHAKDQLQTRNIQEEIVSSVLSKPDKYFQQDDCLKVYQKIIEQDKKPYLYRVFVNICKKPPLGFVTK